MHTYKMGENEKIYLPDVTELVWVLGGVLFNGICPAAVIWWVSGSVMVNLTKGDRFLTASPFDVPKWQLENTMFFNDKSLSWIIIIIYFFFC